VQQVLVLKEYKELLVYRVQQVLVEQQLTTLTMFQRVQQTSTLQ
jgi:hypothetical protein